MAEKLIELPRLLHAAEIRAASFDKEKYTVDVCFTTGATVRRCTWRDGTYDEELIVSAQSVRLERLNAGAPFLNTHADWSLSDVIGAVVPKSARIEGGKGFATIQLSRREDCAGFVQDIADGVICNVSCGYRYHLIEKIEGEDRSVPLWRVTDWEPLEISAVPINADPGAQTRSAAKPSGSEQFPFVMRTSDDAGLIAGVRMRMAAAELGILR